MRARVSARMIDGTTYTAEGEFALLNDRAAFERHFGATAAVIQRFATAFGPDGMLREDVDASQVKEEHLAYLIWRMLTRTAGEAIGTYEEFIERVAGVGIEWLDEEEVDPELDPTDPAPLAAS